MPAISGQVNELVNLPAELLKIAQNLENTPSDKRVKAVADLDLKPVEQCLDVSPVNEPLDNLSTLKADLGPTIDRVKTAVERLASFLSKAPSQIKHAFDIVPCVPMSGAAPPAMQDLLNKLKVFETLDLKPIINMLTQTSATLKTFDVEQVRSSILDFSEFAKKETEQLTDTVSQAKSAAQAYGVAQAGMSALGRLF